MAQRDITDEREYLEDRRAWRERGLSRRDLLRAGAAGALLLGAGGARLPGALAQAPAPPIVKPLPPEWFIPIGTNAEMRWEAMAGQGYLTPAARFFVRNHTATPRIDPRTWRLQVFGSRPAAAGRRRVRACATCARCRRSGGSRSSSAPATGAASSRASRARRRPARSGGWARSASPRGAACRSARCSSARGISRARRRRAARGARRDRGAPTASTRATCAGRSRSARRSTTCWSPTR